MALSHRPHLLNDLTIDGNYGIFPYLYSNDCEKHIHWLETTLDAKVNFIVRERDTREVRHSSISVNGGMFFMADASILPSITNQMVDIRGGTRGMMCTLKKTTSEGEKQWKKALENGAIVKMEYKMQNWGGHIGIFEDPFGFEWMISAFEDSNRVEIE